MHKFAPENALRLERPERKELIPPGPTMDRFGLSVGMTMVDVGAGTGYFARAAAMRVGPSGRVVACDSSPDMLTHMQSFGLPANVETRLSGEYAIPLPDATADLTFMAFVVHETPDTARFVREALRITRPSGRVVILEWKRQKEEHGPPPEERLAEEELQERLRGAGCSVSSGSLNHSHYYVVLEKLPQ